MKYYLTSALCFCSALADTVTPKIPEDLSRPFISGEVWTNPMEDWTLKDGRIVNTMSGGDRNVVSLTSEILPKENFTITVQIDALSKKLKSKGFVGLQIGLQGTQNDYRDTAISGVGLPLGISADGHLFIGNPSKDTPKFQIPEGNFTLTLTGTPKQNDTHELKLQVGDLSHSQVVHSSWIPGLVALTTSTKPTHPLELEKERPVPVYGGIKFGRSKIKNDTRLQPLNQGRGGDARFAFSAWKLDGPAVKHHPERNFGPIWWATYTVHSDKKLRLLVQMAPVQGQVTLRLAGLEHRAPIDPVSYTSSFEISLPQTKNNLPFLIQFNGKNRNGNISPVPTGEHPIKIASLSCNDSTGFPHTRLVENVTAHKPDVITFHGDQIYEAIGGYGHLTTQKPSLRANLCYLRKYAMHGWSWRDLLMTIPSITIPDDHDVMHGNIWGCGGKLTAVSRDHSEMQDSGGYKMSPEFVNMVHKTQVGNLPIPADQPTCLNGISTYYTTWHYGPLDFAILADRQFKSAPQGLFPDANFRNGWAQNLAWNAKTQADIPEAQLLGPKQELFLADWAKKKAPFKVAIPQPPFLAPQTTPAALEADNNAPGMKIYKEGEYPPDDEPKADFDTNGWPQSKQKLALRLLKKANAVHIVGDQHLGTTGQYGIDSYDDGPWWIATPAIANVWPRRWMPAIAPVNPKPGWPRWLGGFEDGFGNKFTMHAVANPRDIDREPDRLFDRAVGYSISTFDLKTGTITLSNWPYTSGPQHTGEDAKPYKGWPVTVKN